MRVEYPVLGAITKFRFFFEIFWNYNKNNVNQRKWKKKTHHYKYDFERHLFIFIHASRSYRCWCYHFNLNMSVLCIYFDFPRDDYGNPNRAHICGCLRIYVLYEFYFVSFKQSFNTQNVILFHLVIVSCLCIHSFQIFAF